MAGDCDDEPETKALHRARVMEQLHSWKDELWTLVLAMPCVLAFTPWTHDIAREGFRILALAPGWYYVTLGACVAFAFGRAYWGFHLRNSGGYKMTTINQHQPKE